MSCVATKAPSITASHAVAPHAQDELEGLLFHSCTEDGRAEPGPSLDLHFLFAAMQASGKLRRGKLHAYQIVKPRIFSLGV